MGWCSPDWPAALVANAATINNPARKMPANFRGCTGSASGSPCGFQAKILFDQTAALFDTNFSAPAVFGRVGHIIQQFLDRRRRHMRARVRGAVIDEHV